MWGRAFYRVTALAILIIVPMALVQYYKDTFHIDKVIITTISMYFVGVPLFYFIEKKYNERNNK